MPQCAKCKETDGSKVVSRWRYVAGRLFFILAAVALFGISLGALASGFFATAALLACPVGMYLMMRMMNKKVKNDD